MTAPVLIWQEDSPENTLTVKPMAPFAGYQGDVLVAYSMSWNDDLVITPSNDGVSLTWTVEQDVFFSTYNAVRISSAVLTEPREGLVVQFTRTSGTTGAPWRGGVALYRGSDGVGASGQAHANSAPSVDITTTGDASAIFLVITDDDGADGTGRVWRTNAGPAVELLYYRDGITEYVAYHPDAGPADTYIVGMSSPSSQWHSFVALEVLSGTLIDVYAGALVNKRKR